MKGKVQKKSCISYHCKGEWMAFQCGHSWTVQNNILKQNQPEKIKWPQRYVQNFGWWVRAYKVKVIPIDNATWAALISLTHLTRPRFKVVFHHPYFKDVGGMAYHWSYCDRFIAADVAVQPFHTVQAQRSRNPKPGLRENKTTLPQGLLILSFLISKWHECLQNLLSHLLWNSVLATSNLHISLRAEIQARYEGLISLTGSIIHKHKRFQS